ncbi:MAG: GrpB family protein [Clostridium sp.]|nr:GrpB family protein [Clostridium sp.]MCM1459011.1 GrpB family protein [Bacteroides sp.]
MGKPLLEMTLEELWELFPIFLVPHNEHWAAYYNEMNNFLCSILSDYQIWRISHIGSTAIKGIWAKNIIDILIETTSCENMENISQTLEANGFVRMSSDTKRASFNWGYNENGFEEEVYHLHLRQAGDNDELYFRDYLNEHSQIAREYEQLKLALWKQYEKNRNGYTDAKSDFVNKWTLEAKKIYGNKYTA